MTTLLAVLLLLLIFIGAAGLGTMVERALARVIGISAPFAAHGATSEPGTDPSAVAAIDTRSEDEDHIGDSALFSLAFRTMLGLVCYLWGVLALKLIDWPWSVASTVPALIGALVIEDLYAEIRRLRFRISIGFAVWLTAILLLGASLVDTSDGIGTPWANNYGDLPWHLGMASSFAFGANFPPEYQIFSGRDLTYPFFTSLLNASTLWIDGSFHSLNVTAVLIWTFAWTVIWIAFDGERRPFLPWALLLGGGSYPFVVHTLSGRTIFGPQVEFAHQVLGTWPWLPFFTTMWVPQRGTWLGLTVTILAVVRFHAFLARDARAEERGSPVPEEDRRMRFELCAIAALLGISPLVHGHFVLVAGLYISLVLLFRVVVRLRRRFDIDDHEPDGGRQVAPIDPLVRLQLRQMVLFGVVAWGLVAAVFLTWISDKAAAIKLTWGWMPWWQTGSVKAPALIGSLAMWLSNAPVWIAALLLLILLRRTRMRAIALCTAFGLFSIVQLTPWDWDQLKAFVALYLVSLCMIGEPSVNRWVRRGLVLLFVVPAAVEVGRAVIYYTRYTVYSAEEVEIARKVREATPPRDIIAGKPDHNSPVTLTGRTLYYGYEGTLSSHGLKASARRKVNSDLKEIVRCHENPPVDEDIAEEKRSRLCPDHILWTAREKGFWKRDLPGYDFAPRLPGILYDVAPREESTTDGWSDPKKPL